MLCIKDTAWLLCPHFFLFLVNRNIKKDSTTRHTKSKGVGGKKKKKNQRVFKANFYQGWIKWDWGYGSFLTYMDGPLNDLHLTPSTMHTSIVQDVFHKVSKSRTVSSPHIFSAKLKWTKVNYSSMYFIICIHNVAVHCMVRDNVISSLMFHVVLYSKLMWKLWNIFWWIKT